jgi:hypothetical protein
MLPRGKEKERKETREKNEKMWEIEIKYLLVRTTMENSVLVRTATVLT